MEGEGYILTYTYGHDVMTSHCMRGLAFVVHVRGCSESLCDGLVADSIICMTSAHRKEDSFSTDRSTKMGL